MKHGELSSDETKSRLPAKKATTKTVGQGGLFYLQPNGSILFIIFQLS